jgi:hypothetical protein
MKTIFNLSFIILLSCIAKTSFSQVEAIPYYDRLNFNNSFFIIAEADAKCNYYAVDISVLSSSIEKAYFEDLAFNESKLVRIDAGNSQIAWFKVKKIHSNEEVSALLLQLKDLTINTLASMTEAQKQDWLTQKGK